MEKSLAKVSFSGFKHGADSIRPEVSRLDEDDSDSSDDTKKMVVKMNRKGKKSGGFQSMGLSYAVFNAIMKKGYRVPTPIQRKCIPLVVDGKDVVAMARTGSGKTAAFLIPLFERLKTHSAKIGARALILSPTRELATQTMSFTKELGRFTGLRATLVLGGDRLDDQFSSMHENPDIIIATPGRFLHLLVEMNLQLTSIEYVVFDEADRLFEMGFAEQLLNIIQHLPETRQTLLFSATLPKQLVDFAKAGLKDPVLVRLDVESQLSDQLKLFFLSTRGDIKPAVLLYLLRSVIPSNEQTVVFAATKHHVEYLRELVTAAGISATHTYSSLDQAARKINVAKFINKKASVMLVTDLAARGIDIPMLDNVINYNFPCKPKLFVHRVGRVARAGRSGCAYSLLSSEEVPYMLDLHLFLGKTVRVSRAPPAGNSGETSSGNISGIYGSVPQSIVDSEEDTLQKFHSSSALELDDLRKVSENAQKQYVRSRSQPAPESVKRAKKLPLVLPIHQMFEKLCSQVEVDKSHLLDSLKSYRPSQTIFEVHSTAKTTSKQIMTSKRKYHGSVLTAVRQKQIQSDPSISTVGTDQTGSCDIDVLQLGTATSKIKAQQRGRDEEHYVHHTPSDVYSEKGLLLGTSFHQEAAGATLDLGVDDDQAVNRKRNLVKWDRKRKKFVGSNEQNDSRNKRIKTESGQWIKASFRTNAYQEWRDKHKIDNPLAGREEDVQNSSLKNWSLTSSFKNRRPNKGGAKNQEDKDSKGRVKGDTPRKRGGRGTVGDLKPKGEILKKRRVKRLQEVAKNKKNKRQMSAGRGRSEGKRR